MPATLKQQQIQEQLLRTLREILEDVPLLAVTTAQYRPLNGTAPHTLFELLLEKGTTRQLVVDTETNGQPRIIREAINRLSRSTGVTPNSYGIVAAPYLSPAAARLCKAEGIGYLDLAGNCHLVFDTVYISREGAKNPFVQKRDLRSLYSPRASRILRVLLNTPSRAWKTHPLAEAAQVSIGQVANVKKLLKDREWTTESAAGFRLTHPAELLQEWSQNYSFRKNEVRDFYCMAPLPAVETALAQNCAQLNISCALTGLAGAARYQPGIRYQRTMCFVSHIPPALLEAVELKAVTSGANVTLLSPYDDGVFNGTETFDGLPAVSPVQLYLDLKNYKGRGEEAAQTIYNKLLKERWQ
jgi:hypothetical protein